MFTMDQADKALQTAMAECARLNDEGIQIGRKRYTTVATRVEVFRKAFGVYGRFRTNILRADDDVVQIKAFIDIPIKTHDGMSASIEWITFAEGDAEEMRNASQINKTSAVENCATSAIGRALAALGIHGGEFASANEVENAVHQQANPPKQVVSEERILKIKAELESSKTLEELSGKFLKLDNSEKKACEAIKDAMKEQLSAQKSGSKSAKASSPAASSAKQQESPPEVDSSSSAA